MNDPKIHIAFRFHGNFYHSYRGDTPDEMGFGKDIRIIRHIIRVLDEYNRRGVPVKGTWDFENYFSLETIMPRHCPDLIEAMRRRVKAQGDEAQIMSYNNGLIAASTAREFEAAIARAITNDAGSGVKDLFGVDPVMARPQEMMYTPGHLSLYRRLGIEAISLFYSAVPFNTFSNFVPPLGLRERFNPLTLKYPGIDETMTLVPACNTGDLIDNLTLRRWVKRLRRLQMKEKEPFDLLLLIDMDADDDFWYGIKAPLLDRLWSSLRGLEGLLDDLAGLDFIHYTTPAEYLKDHPPVGEISFGQDTADGSFDGYSSWAEKWSNQRLWTGIERSRVLELRTRHLLGKETSAASEAELSRSFEERLRALSTTHFGMSSPVMNVTRLRAAENLVRSSVETARRAMDIAVSKAFPDAGQDGSFALVDYPRDLSPSSREDGPGRVLMRIPLTPGGDGAAPSSLVKDDGSVVPCAVLPYGGNRELLFVESMPSSVPRHYRASAKPAAPEHPPVTIDGDSMGNGLVTLRFDRNNQAVSLDVDGACYDGGRFMESAVSYDGSRRGVDRWETLESASMSNGLIGIKRTRGEAMIGGGKKVLFERELLMAAGLPFLYVRMLVRYPSTEHRRFDRGRAGRLEQSWDGRWEEVMPCELFPGIEGAAGKPLRVWKKNACGAVSSYDLDYGRFSKNRELDSCNNHQTHGWMAVTDGARGLLLAETADLCASPAFCPLRTRERGGKSLVSLNPFGTYYGKQLRYGAAHTGLGRFLALRTSDHLDSYAPSYNGREQRFALMVAPYRGDEPSRQLQTDAAAFFYPCMVHSKDPLIGESRAARWSGLDHAD
ncbi:MAG TPA: hypothetical protein ENN21_05715 [Spirochaetes bacterium]|nr:hypothetical protein [Spirochaetota bacterium]